MEPRQHPVLGAQNCIFVCIWIGYLLFCGNAGRADKTVQYAIDGSCAPGLFALVSIPTIIGCIGAFLILLAAIATPIVKTQQMRQFWFYLMSGGIILKIVVMEVARFLLR